MLDGFFVGAGGASLDRPRLLGLAQVQVCLHHKVTFFPVDLTRQFSYLQGTDP